MEAEVEAEVEVEVEAEVGVEAEVKVLLVEAKIWTTIVDELLTSRSLFKF